MILHFLRLLSCKSASKPNLEICARTEDPSITCYNDAFHAIVNVEHGVRRADFFTHFIRKSIIFAWTVQCENDNAWFGGMVFCFDLCPGKRIVGLRGRDVRFVAGGGLAGRHAG